VHLAAGSLRPLESEAPIVDLFRVNVPAPPLVLPDFFLVMLTCPESLSALFALGMLPVQIVLGKQLPLWLPFV